MKAPAAAIPVRDLRPANQPDRIIDREESAVTIKVAQPRGTTFAVPPKKSRRRGFRSGPMRPWSAKSAARTKSERIQAGWPEGRLEAGDRFSISDRALFYYGEQ